MATRKSIVVTGEEKPETVAVKKTVVKKVTPKKAVVKKAVAKKSTSKVVTKKTAGNKRPLVVAPQEQAFWVVNGEVLDSLAALLASISRMEPRVYYYHVHDDQHDFALWVEHVLGDAACAVALRGAKSPAAAVVVIEKHLKRYAL